jgi:hypothetical protein
MYFVWAEMKSTRRKSLTLHTAHNREYRYSERWLKPVTLDLIGFNVVRVSGLFN